MSVTNTTHTFPEIYLLNFILFALYLLWRILHEWVLECFYLLILLYLFIFCPQIPMYGFGGHARLVAKGVPRDGAGRMWLLLHQVPHKTEWETSFSVQNSGDLKAFIKIKPISKGNI
jgi:hypothetical protein